ncbi:MAG: head-tail connector protein [Methyloligellaceae bacterium]
MGYVLKTAPAAEPLTVAEAKSHMRIDTADEDTLLGFYIEAARREVEKISGRDLITQTWQLKLNGFPGAAGEILLQRAPFSSLTSITYTDEDGNPQTMSSSNYEVDSSNHFARVKPIDGEIWPTTATNTYNVVVIEFVTGFGSVGSDVPETYRHAMRLLLSHWNENREATVRGATIKETPIGLHAILSDRMAV